MKIGVDCDGVLTDLSAYYQKYGERFFRRKPDEPDGCSISEMFGCSGRVEFIFGMRYFIPYCKKWPPRVNAAETLRKLADDGHELYQITARKFVTDTGLLGRYSRDMHAKWLNENNFHFKDIFYCSEGMAPEHKLKACRKYPIDVMIDDRPEVAWYLSSRGLRVLLFDTPYNQRAYCPEAIRVKDWDDIYTVITERSWKKA